MGCQPTRDITVIQQRDEVSSRRNSGPFLSILILEKLEGLFQRTNIVFKFFCSPHTICWNPQVGNLKK